MMAVTLLGLSAACGGFNNAPDAFSPQFALVGQVDGPISRPEAARQAISTLIGQGQAVPGLSDMQTLIPGQASIEPFGDEIAELGAIEGFVCEVPLVPRDAEWRVDADGTVSYWTSAQAQQTTEGEEVGNLYDWEPAPVRRFIVARDGRVFLFRYSPAGGE